MKLLCKVLMGMLLLTACSSRNEKKSVPSSKGLPSELLLVVDEAVWQSSAGDSLEQVLQGSTPGLPQHEPMFRMMRVFPRHFTPAYVTMRNILEVRVNAQAQQPTMGVAHHVKARPQVYVRIEGSDARQLAAFIGGQRERIQDAFLQGEYAWHRAALRKKYSKQVYDVALRQLGVKVHAPQEIAKVKQAGNFLWASTDRLDEDMNIVLYTLPFTEWSSLQEGTGRWVELRDSVMKRNIPGSTPQKWMTTTREQGEALVRAEKGVRASGEKVPLMRGLWEMHRGAIGGPFVCVAVPDSAHRRVIVAEGFVYSPHGNKRDLVRKLEAVVLGVE